MSDRSAPRQATPELTGNFRRESETFAQFWLGNTASQAGHAKRARVLGVYANLERHWNAAQQRL